MSMHKENAEIKSLKITDILRHNDKNNSYCKRIAHNSFFSGIKIFKSIYIYSILILLTHEKVMDVLMHKTNNYPNLLPRDAKILLSGRDFFSFMEI